VQEKKKEKKGSFNLTSKRGEKKIRRHRGKKIENFKSDENSSMGGRKGGGAFLFEGRGKRKT